MRLSARRQLTIDASPAVVWKVHTDIDRWSEWQSAVAAARAVGPLAVGSSFDWKSGGLPITSTIRALEPNRRISWTGTSLGTRADHTWTFQPHAGGTLVTTEESMEGWLVNLLKVLAPSFLTKSLDAWLHDLKKRVEATDPSPS